MTISVLVPSFRDGMLMRLFASMEYSQPGSSHSVIVLDNGISEKLVDGYADRASFLPVPGDPFVFSQAFNWGVSFAPRHHDIVALGDDVKIKTPNWLSALEARCASWPAGYGLLTCAETTTASVYGRAPYADDVVELPDVALGAGIVIPRQILREIGQWDESFVGYGFDDFDYGIRLLHAGYLIGVTGAVVLDNPEQASGWVKKLGSYDAMLAHQDINFRRYHEKWHGAVPEKPWIVQRPKVSDHFRRQGCSCQEEDW